MTETYIIIIEAAPARDATPPASVRLRQWLKVGLRAFELRCIDVREVTRSNKQCKCSNGSGLQVLPRNRADRVLPAAGMNTWHGVDCGVASSATGRQT